jgi:hypothetical protein
MQTLPAVRVSAIGDHPQLIGRVEVVERDPPVGVRGVRIERAPVQRDLPDSGRDQIDEGAPAGLGAPEPDHRDRVERGPAGGEVEIDVVGLDAQHVSSGLRLVAGQVESRHASRLLARTSELSNRIRRISAP